MSWIETNTMDQRAPLIGDWLSGRYTKTELCKHHHISQADQAEPIHAIFACKVSDGSYRGNIC
ncbi:MAG: hypothetical protein ACKN9W_15895 [Methylococcus sp.]